VSGTSESVREVDTVDVGGDCREAETRVMPGLTADEVGCGFALGCEPETVLADQLVQEYAA
jgi:hypothetical protein